MSFLNKRYHDMKINILLLAAFTLISGCGVKEQADQLQAMEKCRFEVVSADSVTIAGRDASRFLSKGKLNLIEAPSLAMAFLQQRVPLKGILNLKITNPGSQEAGINNFEYKIFIKNTEIVTGIIDQKITIPANGGSTMVPVKIDKDVYTLLANQSNQQAVQEFFGSKIEKFTDIIFHIKPSFMIGDQKVDYPDFITLNRKLSNMQIISYLEGLK